MFANFLIHPWHYANTYADSLFYDTGSLSATEFGYLAKENTIEGSVLVVLPSKVREMGVIKYRDYQATKAGQGQTVQRFAIAGVGSSDVGAAAFARNLADVYQEPVGAIVAGYGIADLMQEALGGWFVLGGINRLAGTKAAGCGSDSDNAAKPLRAVAGLSPDTATLLSFLQDTARNITAISGHSKGCLSMALAFDALYAQEDQATIERVRDIDLVTVGTVVRLPEQQHRVRQFLGSLDGFGALNSRPSVAHTTVKGAWHHLNTQLPYHVDLVKVLSAG